MLTLILAALGVTGLGSGTLYLSPALRHFIAVKLGISAPFLNEIIAPVSKMIGQLDDHHKNAKAASAHHAKLADTFAGEADVAKNFATNLKAQLAPPQKAA